MQKSCWEPTSALLLAALLAVSPIAEAAEQDPPEDLLQVYDARLLEKLKAYNGPVKQFMNKDMMNIARETAIDVFTNDYKSDNWRVLKQAGDERLARLKMRPAEMYAQDPAHIMHTNGEMALALRVAGVGTRAAMRIWNPNAVVDSFSQMAFGKFLKSEALAFNTIAAGMISAEHFKTTWRGRPAIGADKGLWTVLITYERDDQGSFLPLAIGMYKR